MFGNATSLQPVRIGAMSVTGVLLVALLASFATIGGKPASSDLCGQTITADLELDHDLVCRGPGIRLEANGITLDLNGHSNGITLDLNGHSITGSSRSLPFVGITISNQDDVTILGHGTVTNFRTGILIVNSHDIVVKKVEVTGNGVAASANGDGIRIFSSYDIRLEKNDVKENGNDGIEVFSSTGVEIVKNDIEGNGNDGIEVSGSTGVKIVKNDIEENRNGITFSGSIGNTVEKNEIEENTCGVSGQTLGNTFSKNKFEDNVVDFCTVVIGPRPGF